MKKILLLLVAPIVFMTTLSAQISQKEADEIVIERLSDETKPYCLYAQKEVQTEFEITTATGEVLELGYSAWVYYVSYIGETNGKYLIVKESNGNVLEVNSKNDVGPDDLGEWRVVIYDHSPTISPNKTWNIEVGMPCLEGFCYLGITTIKTGDTKTFNGTAYYELLRTDDPFQQEEEIITYVREDDGQVFFYVEDCDMEYLMYDYNLKVGDEVYLVDPLYPFSFFNEESCEITEEEMNNFYKCKITDIDVIVYDQVARKRLKVEHHGMYDYWIEGIGAMKGITYQISSQMGGTVHQLKDCYEADELIFENENPEYIWDN